MAIHVETGDCWFTALAESSVDVWYARLADFTCCLESVSSTLSPEERSRASGYAYAVDRHRFILRRGLLRHILGRYLDTFPGQIRFACTANGKPVLQQCHDGGGIHFNLSHANGFALYAVSRGGEVGIDLEQVRDIPDWQLLVEEHFSEAEQCALEKVPEQKQMAAFYQGWVRKEAIVKASGEGIGKGLSRIEVFQKPGDFTAFNSDTFSLHPKKEWDVVDLSNFHGFAGALAVRKSL